MTTNAGLRLGTSNCSCRDWVGKICPPGTKPVDFITEYAQTFSTVEVDSTFYAVARSSTVEGWRRRTPRGFLFAAKAPKAITHDAFLEDCTDDLVHFLDTMSLLDDRLGPLLFQFPYYAKRSGVTQDDFLKRLDAFLPQLPDTGLRFAVEVRNKTWLNDHLLNLLGEHRIALALIDHPWMAPPAQLFGKKGIITGDFAYFRWLGDRHGIEKITTTWNETVIDRSADLQRWVPHIKDLLDQHLDIFGYVNNHYAGYAPGNVEQLRALLDS